MAVVLPHDIVGAKIYTSLFHGSIAAYNQTFLLIVSACIVLVLPGVIQKLRRTGSMTLRLLCIASLILLMTGAYFSIMVLATETIHFAQYAMMAILLYPLIGRSGDTLIWTTLLGAVDEGWQYFMLGTSDYFDFNDIVLNFLGAVLGLWIVSLYIDTPENKVPRPVLSPAIITLVLMFCAGFLAVASGGMVLNGIPGNAGVLTLSPTRPEEFWSPFHMYSYHILGLWEALALLFALYCLYRWFFNRLAME
jgi:hypothetical protein